MDVVNTTPADDFYSHSDLSRLCRDLLLFSLCRTRSIAIMPSDLQKTFNEPINVILECFSALKLEGKGLDTNMMTHIGTA